MSNKAVSRNLLLFMPRTFCPRYGKPCYARIESLLHRCCCCLLATSHLLFEALSISVTMHMCCELQPVKAPSCRCFGRSKTTSSACCLACCPYFLLPCHFTSDQCDPTQHARPYIFSDLQAQDVDELPDTGSTVCHTPPHSASSSSQDSTCSSSQDSINVEAQDSPHTPYYLTQVRLL